MSTICIGIVSGIVPEDINHAKNAVSTIARSQHYSVFYDLEYMEPFLDCYPSTALIFSFADTPKFDNCEMLLLPDNCYFNGKTNAILFKDRMQLLYRTAKYFLDRLYSIEFYVGSSGVLYEEFTHHTVSIDNLVELLNMINTNCSQILSLHITIMS